MKAKEVNKYLRILKCSLGHKCCKLSVGQFAKILKDIENLNK